MFKKIYWPAVLGIFGCFLLYLLFSFSSWKEPIMGDEVNVLVAAKALFDRTITDFFIAHGDASFGLWHPPAYVTVVGWLGRLLGSYETAGRLFSVSCFLISLMLIYAIACALFRGSKNYRQIGLLSSFLFAINPLAIRGSLLLDIDGALLNLATLLFIWALMRLGNRKPKPVYFSVLIFLFSCLMWVKLSSPVLLIISMLIYQLWKKDFLKVRQILFVSIGAALLFYCTWIFYCYIHGRDAGLLFKVPKEVINQFFIRNSKGQQWGFLARNIWTLTVWTSVPFMLLSIISLFKVFKQKDASRESLFSLKQFAFYGAVVLLTYMFVGGLTHSFPKYHYAMVPVFSVLIASLVSQQLPLSKKEMVYLGLCFAFLIFFNTAIVSDPLYRINYILKEDIILTSGMHSRQILLEELIRFLLMLGTIPLACLFLLQRVKKPLLAALLVALLAANLSLSLVQVRAGYNTVYCYGAEGVREAARFLRQHTDPAKPIIAPPEIKWLANENLLSYPMNVYLKDSDGFVNAMKRNQIQCLVYGITGNTVAQYKVIFNNGSVKKFLEENYKVFQIGSYTVWLRN